MVEVIKITVTSFKRSHACTTLSAPNPAAGHHQPTPPPETPGHSRASLGQSLVGSLLSPGSWCTGSVAPSRVYFPVLCKFWQLCGGDNGDLLQEGLCHIQVCCTQSPCPCGSPLLTHTSTACILSPCLFNLYAEYIRRNAGLEETQAGIKIAGRNINNLRYADDTTLMQKPSL